MTNDDESPAGVRPGDVLAGKYRVERILGAGGMGVVVAAHHIQLDEKVALKFLLPHALKNDEAIRRFVQEARAAVKIKSEHVARVADVGQLENGAPYIVMEYLEGHDLCALLEQQGPMRIDQAIDFVLQACEALAEAHALGIVHRDLKPANLFCIRHSDGRLSIKVLDFGISKVITAGAVGHDMTRTNAMMGTPFYMSPEQMTFTKSVDVRSDIWSLGVILFELVTGRPPFDAEAVTELAIKVATQPAPPVRSLRLDVPEGVALAIATCLQKDVAQRYQTVGDLAVALKDYGTRHARVSVERVLGTLKQHPMRDDPMRNVGTMLAPTGWPQTGATASLPAAPSTSASWGRTSGAPRSRGKAAVAVAAALVLASGSIFLFKRTPIPPPAISPLMAGPSAEWSTGYGLPSGATTSTPERDAEGPDALSTFLAHPVDRPVEIPPRPRVVPAAPVRQSPSAVAAPVTPVAKVNCTPPYFFDSVGHKEYKPECI